MEADRQLIAQQRAACEPPRVFRLKEDGAASIPSDWECVSPEVIAAEEQARIARAEATTTAAAAPPTAAPSAESADESPEPASAEVPEPSEPSLPFVEIARRNCAAYEAAPNEIRKSDVFREHIDELAEIELTDVRGTLERLSTPQGGGSVHVEIEVEHGEPQGLFRRRARTRFRTPILRPIRERSRLYDAAADLSPDSCVIFSARDLESPGLSSERSKVCDTDEFVVEFTDLRPCDE